MLAGPLLQPRGEHLREARRASLRALELDPASASAHSSLGSVLWFEDWNWDEAGKEFTRALELNGNDPDSLERYGFYLGTLGRHEEAIRVQRHAVAVAPLDLSQRVFLLSAVAPLDYIGPLGFYPQHF